MERTAKIVVRGVRRGIVRTGTANKRFGSSLQERKGERGTRGLRADGLSGHESASRLIHGKCSPTTPGEHDARASSGNIGEVDRFYATRCSFAPEATSVGVVAMKHQVHVRRVEQKCWIVEHARR